MKLINTRIMRVLPALLAITLMAGCAGNMGFKYDLGKKPLKYRATSGSVQNMKIQAMEMQVKSDKTLVFSVQPKGLEDKNYRLAITVDSLEVDVVSPQGGATADASAMIGKSFDMIVSPNGKEIELTGVELLEYDMGMAGKRNVSPDFQTVFPDLAGRPIEVGETWTTLDTLRMDEGGSEVVIMLEAINTLEGFETMHGLECARITAVVTGTVAGEGEQNGAKMTFDGTFSGNDLWHFAHKEGTLVRSVSEATVENTVTVLGPQEMVIPITQTMKFNIVLVD